MHSGWKARDLELLDALDALPRQEFRGSAWRAVRHGRDPLQTHPSGGRWDPGRFDVLYTSLEADGALAEFYFHLARQPVFPSIEFVLDELTVKTRTTLRFADLSELAPLGIDPALYSGLLYDRTQEVGDAAAFLGIDGIIAPSARSSALNLVLFTDHLRPADLEVVTEQTIDWDDWRENR